MSQSKGINRRNFLKNTTLGVAGVGIFGSTSSIEGSSDTNPTEGTIPKIRVYKDLGRTGFKASDIGLGGVTKVEVIRAMLDSGVNYIDTAESYSEGKSEISIGQAIKGRERKSLFINTKLHLKENESKDEILKRARKCLERLDTEYIDCLMNHNPSTLEMVKYEPFHEACAQLKREGKLRFTGISSHGTRHTGKGTPMKEVLLSAVQDGRFSVMLLVYNFIQKDAGEAVIKASKEKNIGITLMKTNPVGRYLSMQSRVEEMKKKYANNPERLKRMENYFNQAQKTAQQGDWFIKKYNLTNPEEIRIASTRFGLSNPGVSTVLARTETFEDMEQFLKASGTTLSDMEAKKLSAFSKGPGKFYCRHACGLCESSCPYNVPVNTIMRYNHYFEAQKQEKYAMEKYADLNTAKADLCESCTGICQSHCPYGVPIHGLLTMAHENLNITFV